MSWRRPLATGSFVLAEALLWFIVLRSIATVVEREGLRDVASEIALGLRQAAFLEPDRAADARELAVAAGESAVAGASFLVVLALAFGGFLLMRLLAQSDLPGSSRAAAGVLVSIAAVGLAVQVTLADGAPWEGGLLDVLRGDDSTTFTREVAAAAFVADPDLDRVRGAARTATVVGLALIWVRFLMTGRSPVTFERVLRSFGIGFGVATLTAFVAQAADADVAGWLVLPYFVLGALALATAHAARAPENPTAMQREAPWVVSVLGTLGLLTGLALLFGVLVLVDAQRAFEPVGKVAATAIAWTLIAILTPIVWLLEQALSPFFGDVDLEQVRFDVAGAVAEDIEEDEEGGFPGWMRNLASVFILLARLLILAGAGWLLYRAVLRLFRRRDRSREEQYVEVRESGDPEAVGGLLRRLVRRPRVRRREGWDWLARSPSYRLFGRMLSASHVRGVERAPGQTPLEFAAAAAEQLEAPPFPGIADTFDHARYGRKEPEADRIAALERAFDDWERTHPLPEGDGAVGAEDAPERDDER